MRRTKVRMFLVGPLALLTALTGLIATTAGPADAEVGPRAGAPPSTRGDVAPGSRQGAAAADPIAEIRYVGEIYGNAAWEIRCYEPGKNYILISPHLDCFHEGAYGVAELRRRSGGHRIEICNFSSPHLFFMTIDPANPDGSSSGRLLWYSDPPGGGCYIRNISYPVRKFRAEWNTVITLWIAPPA